MHQRADIPAGLPPEIDSLKAEAQAAFESLRNAICTECEAIEDSVTGDPYDALPPGRFERTRWERPSHDGQDAGGGTMAIMRGRVFEKIGVNVSEVFGTFSEQFAKEIPGTEQGATFWACGLSLVAHMQSPHVPAAHMNVRHIITDRWWFGGGGDMTPVHPTAEDTDTFHAAYRAACDAHGPDRYPRYKKWCDEYFYLKHRDEPRGVGGIFFDYLNTGDWQSDFRFTHDVGRAYLSAHLPIVRRHMLEPWTDAEREQLLRKRGRYVEFNLIYDRGTRFGLMTGGNPEAVLMSLPPLAAWP